MDDTERNQLIDLLGKIEDMPCHGKGCTGANECRYAVKKEQGYICLIIKLMILLKTSDNLK